MHDLDDEELKREFKALEYRFIKRFQKKPALEAILLLIGFQESPLLKHSQSKEEKLDLINLGMLTVLSCLGIFHRRSSESGWPEFEPAEVPAEADREKLIRRGIVAYFREHDLPGTDVVDSSTTAPE
jgi:hypothetical protein